MSQSAWYGFEVLKWEVLCAFFMYLIDLLNISPNHILFSSVRKDIIHFLYLAVRHTNHLTVINDHNDDGLIVNSLTPGATVLCFVRACFEGGVCTPSGFHGTLTLFSVCEHQRHLPGHHPATLRCERSATTHRPENPTQQRGHCTGTQTLQMLQ